MGCTHGGGSGAHADPATNPDREAAREVFTALAVHASVYMLYCETIIYKLLCLHGGRAKTTHRPVILRASAKVVPADTLSRGEDATLAARINGAVRANDVGGGAARHVVVVAVAVVVVVGVGVGVEVDEEQRSCT